MTITVKHKFVSAIPDSTDTSLVRPTNWNDTHDLTGVGTMAEQNANAVAVTGGTIDGTPVGQTTPAAGKFTDANTTGKVTAGTGVEAPTGDIVADTGKVKGNTGVESPNGGVTAKNDIQTTDGQFKGNGAGLTGTAPDLTAGKAKTVEGLVYNDTTVDIPAGSVVFLKPSATHISVDLADAVHYDQSQVFGVTLNLIPKNGGSGFVCAYGYLEGFDTSSYSYGQLLYLDPANPGKLTDLEPASPNYIVTVANVWAVGATGTLFVNPNNTSVDDAHFIGLLKIAHGGTNSQASPTQGGVAYGDGTKYVFTNVGTSGQLLQSTGLTAPVWVDPSSAAVTRFSAGTTGFTPSTLTGGDVTLAGTLKTTNGGTGLTTYTAGDMVYWDSGTAFTKLPIGSANKMLISTGSAPAWDDVANQAVTGISGGTTGLTATNGTGGSKGAVTLGGTLSPANGGTGSGSTPTSGGVAYGNPTGGTGGTPALSTTPAGTTGQILKSNGASAPSWVNASSVTALTIVNDTTTNSLFYPTFTSATSGTVSQLDVSSPKYTYDPYLGEIQSTDYKGDFVDYRTSPTTTITYAEGRTYYNTDQHALAYYNDVTNNIVNTGAEIQLKVINNTGSTIAAGSPVYVTSTPSGQTYPNVALAKADALGTSNVLGLAHMSIANGAAGYVVTEGLMAGVNTGSFTVGDVLYLSPYSAGQLMAGKPPTGYAVRVGFVAYANTPNGAIYVSKTNLGVTSWSAGTTGLTPNTATTGDVVLAGTLGTANGGTNNTATPTAGTVATGDGTKITYTAAGTSGQILNSNGASTPTWINTSSITAGKATNLAGGSAGVVPYQSATDTTAFTAVGTSGQVLKSNGTSAPTWVNPSSLGANITITDDTSTNSTFYPTFTSATSGTVTGEYVSSTRLSYNPSTGSITTYGDAFFNGMRVGHGAANVTSNSVVGQDSLGVATGGANNTAMGYQSLKSVTSGSNLTAFGYQAGYSATTAAEFNVFGYQAGYSNTDGHGLTALGYQAGYSNVSGYYNSYLGSHSGNALVGQYNTAVGGRSLFYQTTGDYNTFVGADIGLNKTGGSNNAAIGYGALYNNGSGSGSVAIGYYAGAYETGSNAFYVNNQDRTNTAGDKASSLMYGTFNATASSQTLQINAVTTIPYQLRINSTLSLNGTTGTSGQVLTSAGSGSVPTWTTPTTGTVTSVAATVPSFLSVSGSPITTSGTLAISYSGTALPIVNGGTGQTTASAAFNALSPITSTGDLIVGNGTNSATRLAIGTNGYILTSNGTTATWATAPATGLTVTSTTSNTAYNIGFQSASSGTTTVDYINTGFNINPSLGTLTAPQVSASNGIVVNSKTVAASYSIPSGSNAMSAGPMTVASGQTVTVASGSRWVVL